MKPDQPDIIDQAIGWHLRLADADERAWADFIAWLEATPRHAAAYDAVGADDRLIGQVRFPAPPAMAGNDALPPRHRWPWMAGGTAAAAAVLAAAFLAPAPNAPGSRAYQVATGVGERKAILLRDGTRIEMNGDTALQLGSTGPRTASLERGEALFRVRHDAARPFTVTVGALSLHDLGTEFNVARNRAVVTIAVSEGSVLFRSPRTVRRLGAGDVLSVRDGGREIVGTRMAPDLVGGWQTGTLSFDNQTVGDVAAALERLYGFKLGLDGDLSSRPFTGMVHFTGVADRDVPHLAGMVGATWRRNGERWILSDRGSASRRDLPG